MHRGGTSATMWLSAEGGTRHGATGCPGTPLYTDGCSAGKQRCLPFLVGVYILFTTIDVVESRDNAGFPAHQRLRCISGRRYILPFLFRAQQDNSQKLTKQWEVRTIY